MARGRPSRATVYTRLEGALSELRERLGGLPSPKESKFIWSDTWHLEAHHSTALEGNAWVYRQALEPGDWTTEQLLTVQTIRHIHHLAMNPVWQVAPHPDATERETPGSLREHDIHPFGSGMKPPAWPLVPALLETWVTQVNKTASFAARGDLERPLPENLAALRQAAQRGRLDAIQGADDVWRSSRKAVDQYRHTKGERRR